MLVKEDYKGRVLEVASGLQQVKSVDTIAKKIERQKKEMALWEGALK